jgi:transposase
MKGEKMVKKYIVELIPAERQELLTLTEQGEVSARKIKRANMLLLADEGQKDVEIAAVLHTSVTTVERTRRRFVLEGLRASLNERPRPGAKCKLDAKGEAILETLAQSKPPAGRKRWTMQLLADRLVALKVVESISDEAVRKRLKKNA